MNNFIFAPGGVGGVLFGTAGGVAGMALGYAMASYQRHERRQRRLISARAALEKHIQALEALDNDETPEFALELAIKFSRFIQDPATPGAICSILDEDPRAFDLPPGDKYLNDLSQSLRDRPEIAEKLFMAIVAGMKAFTERFPQVRPAFEDLMIYVGVAPVKEAEKVIKVTRKAMSASGPALAH